MKGILLVTILTTKSSYARDTEEPIAGSSETPDTLQWWIGSESAWRIRTFALDHDIHVHSVGPPRDDLLGTAMTNNRKHFSEITASEHLLRFENCRDAAEAVSVLACAGLATHLEVADHFAFWNPDGERYRTQSSPKSR